MENKNIVIDHRKGENDMVEKITVSRDEVIHYPWLDHTWVYVHYTANAVTANPLFGKVLVALFKYGIREATGKTIKRMNCDNGYLFVEYDTDEIIDILKKACQWLQTCGLYVKDTASPKGAFFEAHRAQYMTLLEETGKLLEEKKYKYFFQRVDGMN